MKAIFSLVIVAIVGGVVGSFFTAHIVTVVAADGPPKLTVRELVLVDENNKPAASLTSTGGRTVLSFLGPAGRQQVELGVDLKADLRFLYLLEKTGTRSNASLTSGPPHSEGTLALGDDFWEGKAVLGALRGDVAEKSDGPDMADWGLQFHRSGEQGPVVAIVAPSKHSTGKVHIALSRPNGEYWIVP
jgi:hypothetical protein